VLTAYVGVAALLHSEARDAVRLSALRNGVTVRSAQALPTLPYVELPSVNRLAFASTASASAIPGPDRAPGERGPREVPFPAGPFAWNGFIDDGRTYLRATVEPLTGEVIWRQRAVRGPDVPEVRALRGMAEVETYLWFARFPVVRVATRGGRTQVTFSDLRFGGIPGRRPFLLQVTETPGELPVARWGR
ncbi:MAG: hypothetical protein ACM3L8_05885, partial [Verrucomicrobiota bacterium]